MSSNFDKQFISQHLSHRLDQFSWARENLANFRCPLCGDSKKNVNKRRAFFYLCNESDSMRFKCHNCSEGSGWSLGPWLSIYDQSLQKSYNFTKFKEEGDFNKEHKFTLDVPAPKKKILKEVTLFGNSYDDGIPSHILAHSTLISDLDDDHPARLYIAGRKIPQKAFKRLLYVENFMEFAVAMQPDDLTVAVKAPEDARIVIPFMDANNKELLCFQGRSLEPDACIRYFTVKMHDSYDKIFGLERIDKNKKTIVVEGPLDSLFLPNAVATADSNLLKYDGDIYIPDNQYRNSEIQKLIEKIISSGSMICLFPREYEEYKDLNEFVKEGGMSRSDLLTLIAQNLYKGLRAKQKWADIMRGA